MDTYIVLSCGHEFHYECLEKFVIESTSNLCPNCGKNVKISIKQNKNKRKLDLEELSSNKLNNLDKQILILKNLI